MIANAGAAAGEGLGKNCHGINNVYLFHANVPHSPDESNIVIKANPDNPDTMPHNHDNL